MVDIALPETDRHHSDRPIHLPDISAKGESDAYRIGLYRGLKMGSDSVDLWFVPPKQPNK
jgi:hypothetical protein